MMNTFMTTVLCSFAATMVCQDSDTPPADSALTPTSVVVSCGNQLGIDASAARRSDWGGGSEWTAETHGDTLVISRSGQCGDECHYEERIALASIGSPCPVLVGASISKRDSGSPLKNTYAREAREGALAIQDWNPSGGIVSGRLDAEFSLTFYVTTPAPPESEP